MAATKVVLSHVLVVLVLLSSQVIALDRNESKDLTICRFDAIYNFGDSLSDTGNARVGKPPNNPKTLVPLDYIVKSAGFSSIKVYLDKNQSDSKNGVNFAFAGATTLPAEFLVSKLNINASRIQNTLNNQLQWLDDYLKGFCQNLEDCKEKLKSSLFIIGEIGVNDYSLAFHFGNKTIEKVNKMGIVSENVQNIEKAIAEVIDYGATQVLVPGIYQGGCAPGYVANFGNFSTPDTFGCLKEYNDFFKYHNDLLQETIKNLRKKYPGVSIIYGDYYNAMQFLLDNHQKFGFEYVTKACDKCVDPEKYIFSDVFHST